MYLWTFNDAQIKNKTNNPKVYSKAEKKKQQSETLMSRHLIMGHTGSQLFLNENQ